MASEEVIEQDKKSLQKCIDGGVEVVEFDKDAFKAAAEATYDQLGYRELKDKLMNEIEK